MTGAPYVSIIDITGENFARAPLVPGGIRFIYVTGTHGIEETAAQVAEMAAAGMGAGTIDQTPGLLVFAAGKAAIADVEPYAGLDSSAHAAVAQRQSRGEDSTLYVSYGNWPALKADIASPQGVSYGVANWAWSLAQAEAFLAANPDVAFVQYGSPATNPGTLVPGTDVTLAQADADIDVAKAAWAAQFLPAPQPPVTDWTEKTVQQLPVLRKGDKGAAVMTLQGALLARRAENPAIPSIGDTGPDHNGVDGDFEDLTDAAVRAVQRAAGLPEDQIDGEPGPVTWPLVLGIG